MSRCRSILIPAIAALSFACSEEEPRNGPINPTNPNNGTPDSGVPVTEHDSGVPVQTDMDAGVVVEEDAGNNPNDGVETMELGSITIGSSGDSEEISFELPDGVVSFALLIRGTVDGYYIVKRLTGPLGTLVTDDASNVTPIEQFIFGQFAPQFKSPNRVVQDRGLAAFAFPNNPSVQVSGGMHTAVISAFSLNNGQPMPRAGSVDVAVQYRREAVVTGHINVSLYFTGAGGLTADTAPTSPLIMGALDHLRTIYEQANIHVGDVAYYDIDPMFETISGIDGSGDDLERMFELTNGKGAGLHYFIVQRFEAGALPGANVAGVSGGLPGPGLSLGSPNSGVAVALAPVMDDPSVLAHVMAHEGGHWLGLFHTAEIIGTEDQMPDTPSGQASNTFLMYPTVGGGTSISTNQANVMRQHPEVVAQ
jgi:hypothetical protein